ncbi:hypothetical protein MW887_011930 [Aspergillus wentii]|nr:hypothetical protein MW887_011930 [Aspergillus wentii]
MSGPGEDRWRGGRQPSQRQSGPRGMGAGSRGGQNANVGNAWADSREQGLAGPALEHVPVRGFNSAEAKRALRKGPGDAKTPIYKPTGKDANNNKAGGPWGSKPNTMANGKDFFLELRKQITTLRQGGNVAGG